MAASLEEMVKQMAENIEHLQTAIRDMNVAIQGSPHSVSEEVRRLTLERDELQEKLNSKEQQLKDAKEAMKKAEALWKREMEELLTTKNVTAKLRPVTTQAQTEQVAAEEDSSASALPEQCKECSD